MIIAAAPGESTSSNPHVDIVVTALPTGTATLSVWRSVDGVRNPVRDLTNVTIYGGDEWPATDWEAPFGREIVYDTVAWSASGATLGSAQSTAVTLAIASPWISDPLAPGNASQVRFTADSWTSLTRSRGGGSVPIAGSSLPVAVTDVRNAGAGIPIGIYAPQSDVATVRDILNQADPVLLRVPSVHSLPIPGAAYLTAADVVEQILWVQRAGVVVAEGSIFSMAADLVAAQNLPVAVPPRTWRDLLDEAATWADVTALYATWTDLLRGP